MKYSRILHAASIIETKLASPLNIPNNATVFSMIQPTGVFHVGNYLGAIRSWVDIAESAPSGSKIIYGIADLHAITIPKDPKLLLKYRQDALASLLASGVNPDKCILYFQSSVPAHTQLHWVLSTISGMGYLSRMVQWKSKIGLDESTSIDRMNESMLSKLQLGLFSYPVLQAADILLHKASLVPVGDDQSQHLELTRYITSTFNHRYCKDKPIFPVPSTLLAPFKKILSLRDSSKKMSKSDPDQNGCLYITDTPETIQKKIRKALTDSSSEPIVFDAVNRPAIANLILMAAGVTGLEPEKFMKEYFPNSPQDHRHFKQVISDVMIEKLNPIRQKYEQLKEDGGYLNSIAKKGAEYARESGERTIKEVYEAIGFR